MSTGDGSAGDFQVSNASSAAAALKSTTNGTGRAGQFQVSNSANSAEAAYAYTNGAGSAIRGYTVGTGYAGSFQVSNSSSTSDAVYATTNGTGSAVKGYATGTSTAGEFQINKSTSSADALYAITNGLGNAVTGSAVSGSGGYFTASGQSSKAVYGSATYSDDGYNYGGYFVAAGVNGFGVYGTATGTTAVSYGGYFQTASSSGSGVRARNTSNGNEGQLGGPDYGVKATGDLIVTGDAQVTGDLVVTGAVRGDIGPNNGSPFPRPAYNSGWIHLEQNASSLLNHNVGGDVDDYVIDMQMKDAYGVIYNEGLGGDSYDAENTWGADYKLYSNTQIRVHRCNDDPWAHYVRIRIWVCN